MLTKSCAYCGIFLGQVHALRKYCSSACKNKAFGDNYKKVFNVSHSAMRYQKKRKAGLCGHCGKTPAQEGKAYCLACETMKAALDTASRRRRKQKVIDAYGGKCACCGEHRFEFLSIDHINGGGKAHRATLRLVGNEIYRWLESNGFPKDKYRLLCYNCNLSHGYYGYCPHQREHGNLGTKKVNI